MIEELDFALRSLKEALQINNKVFIPKWNVERLKFGAFKHITLEIYLANKTESELILAHQDNYKATSDEAILKAKKMIAQDALTELLKHYGVHL